MVGLAEGLLDISHRYLRSARSMNARHIYLFMS
jgi:hypothetical protein